MKLIMLKGLPGSGKSTWAKEFVAQNPNWVRVNKDSLREMMASYRPGKDEALILGWRDHFVMRALLSDRSVIVDDTNFHLKHEIRLKDVARQAQNHLNEPVGFETLTFGTPLEQCIKNDLKRPNSVGEKVIRKMHKEFLAPDQPKQNWKIGLPKAVIVDIDGTVALHVDRSPYDTSRYHTDKPNKPVVEMVREFARQGFHIIFTSGRDEASRDVTTQWLWVHIFGLMNFESAVFSSLNMRPTGDRREDSIVKQELYEKFIKGKYNVFAVLDDRNRVVEMWRRNGLTCLQVAEGDF